MTSTPFTVEWQRPLVEGLTAKQDALLQKCYDYYVNDTEIVGPAPRPKRDADALVKKGMATIEEQTLKFDRLGYVQVTVLQITPVGVEAFEACYEGCPG